MKDYDLAVLAGDAYAASPAGKVHDWKDLRAVVYERGELLVVTVRGTVPTSFADWERDVSGWPVMAVQHPLLGHCHSGFLTGAEGLLTTLVPALAGRRYVLSGHSLGGAVAILLSAIQTTLGHPPELIVTWEAPRAGGSMLRAVLQPIPVRQYRYGDDPVTELPWLPGIYEHVREPLIHIGHPMLDPISCHSIAGIIAWEASCPTSPGVTRSPNA